MKKPESATAPSNRARKFIAARHNPFSAQRISCIPYRFESGDWRSQLQSLQRLGYRASIVGPQGTGKTTLLSELAVRINSGTELRADYFFLPRSWNDQYQMLADARAGVRLGHVALLDGVERIPFLSRLDFFRTTGKHGKLVVTAHRPFRCPPNRLPIWIRTRSSPALLDHVLTQLKMSSPGIEAFARQSFAENRGNIRNVLRELYDSYAELQ